MSKPNFYRIALSASLSFMLSACGVMNSFEHSNKGIASAEQKISAIQEDTSNDAAVYIDRPEPNLVPIEEPEGPAWINQTVASKIDVSQLPIEIALGMVLKNTDIVIQFDNSVKPSHPITFTHEGSVKSAFEKIAAITNLAYSATENKVSWNAFITETFTLPVPAGDKNFMIGKKKPVDDEAGASESGDTSAFDVDKAQYSNTVAENVNTFNDAQKSVAMIVEGHGKVVASESSSTLLVRTTPDRMETVRHYILPLIKDLSMAVLLDVRVLQVTTESAGDAGIDWAAAKETARSTLNFVGESPFGIFTDSAPVAFSGTRNTGTGSITTIVKALEQQGKVSFITEQAVISKNGSVAEIELAAIETYLKASRTTNTSDVGSTQELIPGVLQGGYVLNFIPKIFNDNQIMIALTNSGTEIEEVDTVGTELNFIQAPKLNRNRFNLEQIITDGTTIVAAAIKREENMQTEASPLKTGWASTSAGSRHRVTEIYLLITPHIIKGI